MVHKPVNSECSRHPGGHSFLNENVRQRGPAESVPVHAIDSYLAEKGIDRPLRLLKIDVQRFEAKVVAGAAATIARDRPVVMCEVTPEAMTQAGDSCGEILDFFERLGYRAHPILSEPGSAAEMDFAALRRLLLEGGMEYVDVAFVPGT